MTTAKLGNGRPQFLCNVTSLQGFVLAHFFEAFLFYIAFFTIAVFNILTGIFVEKALHMSDQADRAVEYMKQEREDAQDLRQICNRTGSWHLTFFFFMLLVGSLTLLAVV